MNLKVRKRDGKLQDFNGDKIVNATRKAFEETKENYEKAALNNVVDYVYGAVKEEEIVDIEEIQDYVETFLIENQYVKTAKAYILYRAERSKYHKKDSNGLLSNEFLSKYKKAKEPFNQLGSFVFYRTYSRFLPEEGRRERWWETVRRAVEYNCSLAPTPVDEAEKLYDNIFNLKQVLSGRTMFTGNTEASKLYPMSNFNCFKRDTEFLTRYGIKSFYDFKDGDTVEVLNGNGAWSESKVRNFGKQDIVKLTVKRKGTVYKEDIYTTRNHLWFVKKNNEKKYEKKYTKDLKGGDVLRKKYRYEHQNLNTCPIGVVHGIVFGDGTYDKFKKHCRVSLIGKKQSLLEYFDGYPQTTEGSRDSTCVYGLPYYFKKLPPLDANVEYLKGFIKGVLLTDGAIGESVRLSLSDEYALRQVQSMCEIIGITTSEIREQERVNNNFGEYSNPFAFTIHKESLVRHGLLENAMDLDWEVVSVEDTGIFEDVWCVVESETNSFTLRGGIHTHNCSGMVMDSLKKYGDLFYLLLVGAGVGIRVLKGDVDKLPLVRGDISLINEQYKGETNKNRSEYTSLKFKDDFCFMEVGDSKEGK